MQQPTTTNIHQQLHQAFGFQEFRPGQQQTIEQLLAGHSSLAIFPTGSGKSLCYQLTALQLPHLTLVVSPLLALMKDQLTFLHQQGIAAASIDSTLSHAEYQQVVQRARTGELKILMISVERFKNERFRTFIQSIPISMLVVDEAHCISEWGHNFRPDYLKLPEYRKQLDIPLVLLLTATATRRVQRDMAEKFAIQPNHIVQTGFYRANLNIAVETLPAGASRDASLLTQIQAQQGCGIVYVTLQKTAESAANFLRQNGIQAEAYHAGLKPEQREAIQQRFMQGTTPVIVATIAFGMGIDKSDIRFVIHYDLPKSIENYSQEIGRAGRDGQPANCITFASLQGVPTLENFIIGDTPLLSSIQQLVKNLREESFACASDHHWETQLYALSMLCNIRQLPLKTLLVQLELMGLLTPLRSYFAEYKYKLHTTPDTILSRFEGERRTFLNALLESTAFKKVWGIPDFEQLYQHYGAERQRAIAALEYLHEQQLIELSAGKMTEVYRVDLAQLEKSDPAAQLHRYMTDNEQKELDRIEAMLRFFQLDRCLNHNLSAYFGDLEAPATCGHCSVCHGKIAQLPPHQAEPTATTESLQSDLAEFYQALDSSVPAPLSQQDRTQLAAHFLAGVTQPIFTPLKARKMNGFGRCETMRYREIVEQVSKEVE